MKKYKYLAKNRIIKNKFQGKIAALFKFTATLGIWAALAVSILWIFGAVGWFLTATFWFKELFVPESIYSTAVTIFNAFVWAVLLIIFALLWSRYNYFRYYRNNKRKLLPLKYDCCLFDWKDILSDNSGILYMEPNAEQCFLNETPLVLEKIPCGTETGEGGRMVLKRPIRNKNREVVVRAGDDITEEYLLEAYRSGYYMQLISDLSKQLDSENNDGLF